MIIDGKKESDLIKQQLKEEIISKKLNPKLVVIQIGDDERSNIYVKNKEKSCEKIGIQFQLNKYPQSTKEETIIKDIENLNNDSTINGIILQLPIPENFNTHKILNTINYKKDVDGLTDINLGKLMSNQECFSSCTPNGILYLLKKYNIELSKKNVVIIGRSLLVGKPLALLLLKENATVTICHTKTKDIKEYTKNSDILIVATGQKHLINKDYIKENSVIIDVGITSENKKIYGDVDFESVRDFVKYITPVPGGVGPMTIAMLLKNVVKSCEGE